MKVLVITWRHGSCKIKFIYIFFFLRADNFWLRLDVVIFDPYSELILFLTFSFRSSHWRCSVKKGVLRNFAKFTGNWLSDCFHFFSEALLQMRFSCLSVSGFSQYLSAWLIRANQIKIYIFFIWFTNSSYHCMSYIVIHVWEDDL